VVGGAIIPGLTWSIIDMCLGEKVAGTAQDTGARQCGCIETVFEIAWQLRSMDRLFQDMFCRGHGGCAWPITWNGQAQAYARAGVDILMLR
jgi:hypothetical protein